MIPCAFLRDGVGVVGVNAVVAADVRGSLSDCHTGTDLDNLSGSELCHAAGLTAHGD
jgi:hypothetical protein